MEVGMRMPHGSRLPLKWWVLVFVCLATSQVFAQERLLIVRNAGKSFEEVIKGMVDEFGSEFVVEDLVIQKETKSADIASRVDALKPRLIVLMDNAAIRLYRGLIEPLGDSVQPIPSVSLMCIQVGRELRGLRNAAGIAYEIPIATSAVSLRSILDTPLRKVGVIHRPFMAEFVKENAGYCKREKIELVAFEVSEGVRHEKAIREGLKKLVKEDKVDALWIPNDNILLKPAIIQSVWLPLVRSSKLPVIVGVEVLVSPQLNFGTFAVLPDHVALGAQAAEMIFDVKSNEWTIDAKGIDPPLSIYKIINPLHAKQFKIPEGHLRTVDKVAK